MSGIFRTVLRRPLGVSETCQNTEKAQTEFNLPGSAVQITDTSLACGMHLCMRKEESYCAKALRQSSDGDDGLATSRVQRIQADRRPDLREVRFGTRETDVNLGLGCG